MILFNTIWPKVLSLFPIQEHRWQLFYSQECIRLKALLSFYPGISTAEASKPCFVMAASSGLPQWPLKQHFHPELQGPCFLSLYPNNLLATPGDEEKNEDSWVYIPPGRHCVPHCFTSWHNTLDQAILWQNLKAVLIMFCVLESRQNLNEIKTFNLDLNQVKPNILANSCSLTQSIRVRKN